MAAKERITHPTFIENNCKDRRKMIPISSTMIHGGYSTQSLDSKLFSHSRTASPRRTSSGAPGSPWSTRTTTPWPTPGTGASPAMWSTAPVPRVTQVRSVFPIILYVFHEELTLSPGLSKCLFHPVTLTKPGSGAAASLCSNRILPSFWILFSWPPHWRKLNCSQKSQNVRYFLPGRPLTASLGP